MCKNNGSSCRARICIPAAKFGLLILKWKRCFLISSHNGITQLSLLKRLYLFHAARVLQNIFTWKVGDENPPWTNRPQSSVFGAKAVVWSGATEFSREEVKLWVCDNHTSTQRAGEREGGKRASHMFHSWAFLQVKRLSEVFTDTVLSSSLLLDSPPQDERSGDGTRTRLTDAACANAALPLLVLPFADRSAATADIRIALWEARLTSGASGERVFAYGCFCHRLSCRSLGVWLREESGSLLAQCAAAGSRVSSGNFMPISGCSQRGQWIAVAHGSRRQFPGAEFAHLMGFYHRWRQNGATKGLGQLEPWYNKDNNNFLPRFNSQLRWDKTLKEVLKRTTLRLNFFFFFFNWTSLESLRSFDSQNALPYEKETAHVWLGFLGHRGAFHARVRLPGLHGGDTRLQVPEGHGGVQAAGDAVWPGAACQLQGHDGQL